MAATKKLYVEGATNKDKLDDTLKRNGVNNVTVTVFKTGAIVECDAAQADAILAVGELGIDGTDFKVTPPRERPASPAVPAKRPQTETPKAKPGTQPRRESIAVTPRRAAPLVIHRADVSGDKAEVEKERRALDERRKRLDERESSLNRRETRMRDAEKRVPKFGPAVTDFLLRNGAGAVLLYPQKFQGQDLCAAHVLPEHRALLVGTPADTARTLALIRAFLRVQILSSNTEKDRVAAVKGLESFEAALEVEQKMDAEAAIKRAPLATIADSVKAKEARNASPTVETPVPTPAPTTEETSTAVH